MKGHLLIAASIAAASTMAFAYQTSPSGVQKHVTKVMAASSTPVSDTEARETFDLAERAIRKALKMPSATPSVSIPRGTGAVSRTLVVAEMTRLLSVLSRQIKVTLAPVKFDPTVLKLSDPKQKQNLTMLVRMGVVARVGPLATGPGDTLTVPQFGDAIGFFLSRVAELTQLPSNRWTPGLQPPP